MGKHPDRDALYPPRLRCHKCGRRSQLHIEDLPIESAECPTDGPLDVKAAAADIEGAFQRYRRLLDLDAVDPDAAVREYRRRPLEVRVYPRSVR